MKTCLIEQTCGLGDILLSLKIGCLYKDMGYRVIWPVEPVYSNLKDKILLNHDIEFPCVSDPFDYKDLYLRLARTEISDVTEVDGALYVPIRRSFHSSWGKSMQRFDSHDASNMLAKFLMCNTTHDNWQDYFGLKRDYIREAELIKALKIDGPFHFINKLFGTPPRWKEELSKKIVTPSNLKRVEMNFIEGYNVFDWLGVLERASKIDSVSTSTFYFFEKLDLNCTPTIYSRNTSHRSYEENFGWLKALAKKNYNFVS